MVKVLGDPLAVLQLAFYRILACLMHIRPYYSNWHKLLVILILLPIYIFAVQGFFDGVVFSV